ncbi:MAG: hypothetical protein IKQ75_01715 [Bacteroidales bacterium]|nr:hypothetical protein [Bacteroidales bacterium]MBR6160566.1 hypothetical protein [Bacteroidales bacterium]
MKKYTNKILVVTLAVLALLIVVVGTVEIRKAYHNGQIKTTKEIFEDVQIDDDANVTILSDSVVSKTVFEE